MIIGFAEFDITPPTGTLIPGGFTPCHTSEPPRGRLLATAIAITSADEHLIMVSSDTLSMQSTTTDRIRAQICEATGVSVDRILIGSTHIHTGGATEYQLWLCPPNPEVAKMTQEGIINAAVAAFENRTDAKLGVGLGEEKRYSFCRDYFMSDGSICMNPPRATAEDRAKILRSVDVPDHSVNVMRIDSEDGEVRGFIVNYANHPDCHAKNKKSFSADFPGALRRNLKRIYGENVFVLFFNGTAGDINCIDYKYGTDKSYYGGIKNAPEAIGAGLAATVVEINTNIDANDAQPHIASISENIQLDRRYKTQADYEWACEIAKDMESHGAKSRAFATEYLESDDDVEPVIDFEIHTIRLGPWAIVGLPSEIFTDVGRRIKRASPFEHTLIFELSNGTHGYIATEVVHSSTAYESKVSKINACTAPDSADRIVNAVRAQLARLVQL